MNNKVKVLITIIVILCVLVLIGDLIYFLIVKNRPSEDSKYYDSINSFIKLDSGYVAVGSNNSNDKHVEKGKITKYDSKYNKIWEKFYNVGLSSVFYDVVKDGDDYIAVGEVKETKKQVKENTSLALIVKYDKEGNIIFNKTFSILDDSKFRKVKIVDDGYVVVGQSIYENSTLGVSNEGGAVIMKYDKKGEVLWQHNYGGNKSGLYNDFEVLKDYIYVVGKDYGRVGIISKYQKDGTYVDTASYKFTDTLGFTGITTMDDDLVVVGAKKISEDEFNHDTDAIMVKYSNTLKELSSVIYRGKGIERFNTLTSDDSGNLVAVGHTAILDKKKSTKEKNIYTYDAILAKYKYDLKKVYVVNYGKEKDDYFTDIKIDGNNYLVSGYSNYKGDGYLAKFILYTSSGKLVEVK